MKVPMILDYMISRSKSSMWHVLWELTCRVSPPHPRHPFSTLSRASHPIWMGRRRSGCIMSQCVATSSSDPKNTGRMNVINYMTTRNEQKKKLFAPSRLCLSQSWRKLTKPYPAFFFTKIFIFLILLFMSRQF